ncbi:MAG: hypothetical protein JWO36_7316 [Myxococcales bacterium]|nr:hypothetical protein [Myxococcales bacterium]
MLTLSGTAASIGIGGRTPEQGVAVTAYKVSDDTMIGTGMTDASGNFTLTVASNGVAVDGYLKATKATFKDTYLYPPAPLTANFSGATVLLLTPAVWMQATQLAGGTQTAGNGWIGILVVDANMMAVAGATVSSTPAGMIHYNDSSGLPHSTSTVTAADGIGYDIDVASGQVSVSAAKAGATFNTHSIKARPDQVTLTIVSE